ncbi:MAG: ABC transporter permease subunit [Truepera sp.]|nr:ABC transporter permease subunit [Truepera sp.]
MRKRLALPILLLPGVGYLLFFFGIPLLLAIMGGFGLYNIAGPTGFTLENYRELLVVKEFRDGLVLTLYLAFMSTGLSLLVSVPLAALLQLNFVGKKAFNAIYKVPLVVPSVVAAFLVLTFIDRGGMTSRVLALVDIDMPKLVRDRWAIGVLIAMIWKSVPFMTLIIGGSMSGISKDILHAARTLGARPLTIFLRMQVPLALPGITAATLLVFIGGMGAFVVPNLLGPIYPLPLSVHMYDNAFEFNEWGLVSAMGTLITVVSTAVLLTYYRLTRGAQRAFQAGR